MITSFDIERYRCFSHASASSLSRINVIVGQSGTGKTALLEALFICAGGSPQNYFNILNWRGVVGKELRIESDTYDLFFREMFHKFDIGRGISLRIEDSHRGPWTLEIGPGKDAQKRLLSPQPTDVATYTPIVFSSVSGSGKAHTITLQLEGGLKFEAPPEPYQMHFLNNATLAHPDATASRFSQLVQDAREESIIHPLSQIYRDIADIRHVNYGGGSVLLATVGGLGRIPVSSVSGGINKYLTILITLGYKQRTVLLVDEIENGLYYADLTDAWNGILAACRATESQVFVTTHSRECLAALLPLLEKDPSDFTLIRTERLNGEIVPVQFSGIDMNSSLKQGFEVR